MSLETGLAIDGGSVIGAGDIDFNGGLIVEDAIGDGDLVGEGECFAVSEELEGLETGVKGPVEDCGVAVVIDDGVRADVEEGIEVNAVESGIERWDASVS